MECSIASVHFMDSHFGGTPFVILVDLLTSSISVQCEVEGVVLFLVIGDPSGTLDGVSGRDAIVGMGDSFPSVAGISWKGWFSSIRVLEIICFSSHSVVFKHGLMCSHVLLSFWLEFSILYKYE